MAKNHNERGSMTRLELPGEDNSEEFKIRVAINLVAAVIVTVLVSSSSSES